MTLEEIKDQVAYEYKWVDWICFLSDCPDFEKDVFIDKIAQRYAQSQTQELQEQNKEIVSILDEILNGTYSLPHSKVQKAKELLTKYNHLNKKP